MRYKDMPLPRFLERGRDRDGKGSKDAFPDIRFGGSAGWAVQDPAPFSCPHAMAARLRIGLPRPPSLLKPFHFPRLCQPFPVPVGNGVSRIALAPSSGPSCARSASPLLPARCCSRNVMAARGTKCGRGSGASGARGLPGPKRATSPRTCREASCWCPRWGGITASRRLWPMRSSALPGRSTARITAPKAAHWNASAFPGWMLAGYVGSCAPESVSRSFCGFCAGLAWAVCVGCAT